MATIRTSALNRKQRRELARRLQAADPGLDVMHPDAAGIDVGNSVHYVAVRPDRDPDSVRRFECFTTDLHRLADWLVHCGVTTVAMQSTGVYWIPLFEILEARGLEVYLVNARHTKNLPGRKTDVQESQWLLKLHTYGLLRNSFHPPADIRVVRTYWRQRGDHVHAIPGTTSLQHLADNHVAPIVRAPEHVLEAAGALINEQTVAGHRYHDAIRPTIDTEEFEPA